MLHNEVPGQRLKGNRQAYLENQPAQILFAYQFQALKSLNTMITQLISHSLPKELHFVGFLSICLPEIKKQKH